MESRSHKVLYIEDQPEMIELVRLTLRRNGCEVYGAVDGAQGVAMMRDLRPDVVLLDLMLPGWDGWQVHNAMQADDALKSLPVILVTARAPGNGHVAGRQPPPAAAYITKPFSLAEIRSKIDAVLTSREQPRATV
jgi:DNA-binding response OmpR family regulator